MAYDERDAELMRAALGGLAGLGAKKMFGGLCFLLNGNMLCGVHGDGGMARVGKDNEPDALEFPGVAPLSFTGRPMGGMVELDASAMSDPDVLGGVLDLALDFVAPMPPK